MRYVKRASESIISSTIRTFFALKRLVQIFDDLYNTPEDSVPLP